MRDEGSAVSTIRRRRRRHPTQLRTGSGVVEIIPGLSTWTAEDLVEAGGWDDELAGFSDSYEEHDASAEDPDD